jgi:hypothetical protein
MELCHEMNIFLKYYNIKYGFKFFYFLVDEIIKLKVLACSFEIIYYFENVFSTLFKDPRAAVLTLKILEACSQ